MSVVRSQLHIFITFCKRGIYLNMDSPAESFRDLIAWQKSHEFVVSNLRAYQALSERKSFIVVRSDQASITDYAPRRSREPPVAGRFGWYRAHSRTYGDDATWAKAAPLQSLNSSNYSQFAITTSVGVVAKTRTILGSTLRSSAREVSERLSTMMQTLRAVCQAATTSAFLR